MDNFACLADTEDVGAVGAVARPRVARFVPATEEEMQEWKEGKRELWRFDYMNEDGKWVTNCWCNRIEYER